MTRRSLRPCIAAAVSAASLLAFAGPAPAGAIADRVRHDGILHCAAIERPGYATIEADVPVGRAADLCRRIAVTVLHGPGRFALRLLDLDDDFDRVRRNEIELVFLEPRIATAQRLETALASVGEAYNDHFAVMVPAASPARTLAGLAGQTICFMIGDPVWPLLQDGLGSRGVSFRPFGFSETVEMKDAYNVGRCGAMAGAAATLDDLRADQGVNHLQSRLIDEPLGPDPVLAMTPRGDPEWTAEVRAALFPKP